MDSQPTSNNETKKTGALDAWSEWATWADDHCDSVDEEECTSLKWFSIMAYISEEAKAKEETAPELKTLKTH